MNEFKYASLPSVEFESPPSELGYADRGRQGPVRVRLSFLWNDNGPAHPCMDELDARGSILRCTRIDRRDVAYYAELAIRCGAPPGEAQE